MSTVHQLILLSRYLINYDGTILEQVMFNSSSISIKVSCAASSCGVMVVADTVRRVAAPQTPVGGLAVGLNGWP